MKNRCLLLFSFCFIFIATHGQTPSAKATFDQYLSQAQAVADKFPQEKAYLHFDNTSYYVGDTIWFKAYVTLAENQLYSNISRPLYVELIDQTGHLTDRQIVKMDNGEGNGQLVLPLSMLSGYYEVRAYTRWMLAFDEPQYFSRTIPIYKLNSSDVLERSISTYNLSQSMEARPERTKEKLNVQFFPEGGNLIEGITSTVAFEAESKNEGEIKLSGTLYTKDGAELCPIVTMHEGMGCFQYTPTNQPAVAKFEYNGKKYEYALPKALPNGFTLSVGSQSGGISVKVASNANTPQDTLAVFISYQGRPHLYQMINCEPGNANEFIVPTRKLPGGVWQVSLINRAGATLSDRFVFIYPNAPLQISATGLQEFYSPYAPIQCVVQLNNAKGEPLSENLSVSVRDAIRSDYIEYDNSIFTDLLLTSDLKGYIHQPGYYFSEASLQKQKELDVLLMVRGWRKYDMSRYISSTASVTPTQAPEEQLMLCGEVKSTVFKSKLKNIDLSVMIKEDDKLVTGSTVTDENGRFCIPMEGVEGSKEAVIQTRTVGKEHNKDAAILMDRNFSPAVRSYGYEEMHPQLKDLTQWQQQAERFDSLYMDSIRKAEGMLLLDEVQIKARNKNKSNIVTKISDRSIDAYYDVRRSVDLLRDEGKIITTIPEFMDKMSPNYYWNRSTNEQTYKQKEICYIMNNHILTSIEVEMMLTEIDGLASIIISKGVGGLDDEIIQNSKKSEVTNDSGIDISKLDRYSIFYLIPLPRRDLMNKHQTAALGTRQTIIQGYTPAIDFYKPSYPNKEPYMDAIDKRRTLYWNPSLKTDENGKAVIDCYNNQYSTPLIIQIETLSKDGKMGSVTYSTVKQPVQ